MSCGLVGSAPAGVVTRSELKQTIQLCIRGHLSSEPVVSFLSEKRLGSSEGNWERKLGTGKQRLEANCLVSTPAYSRGNRSAISLQTWRLRRGDSLSCTRDAATGVGTLEKQNYSPGDTKKDNSNLRHTRISSESSATLLEIYHLEAGSENSEAARMGYELITYTLREPENQ
jgi:hypothetical protein